uniref:Bcr/CflA family efflux transporter n=1 Tax=Magnetococcus massalia (strain MO-1) TaxID=451514 RepID=A0A1S7LJ72_MAGMO|nr:Putative drug resistance transporter, Bcr/CflA subfamily [Candidatus Magnetococcus massalia]
MYGSLKNAQPAGSKVGLLEFILLMASMMAVTAFSIDTMLPALPAMGQELGVNDPRESSKVISVLFLGYALGQFFFGPISDTTGRKPMIYLGLVLFLLGSLLSYLAQDMNTMLLGRALQGVGIASPRTVSTALIRDLYTGPQMARIMSMVITIFILVPVLAPTIGQGILMISDWRMIFALFLLSGSALLLWFALRQPETLPLEKRHPLHFKHLLRLAWSAMRHRITLAYTLATGLAFGSLVGYLMFAQPLLQDHFGLGKQFPLYFGFLALFVGIATLLNSRLVMRWGMQRLTQGAMVIMASYSASTALYIYLGGVPLSLAGFMVWGVITFFCLGVLFGNFGALALEPMGKQAGVAASVVGAFSSLISVGLGTLVGQAYEGTALPLVTSFALSAISALIIVLWAEQGREHEPMEKPVEEPSVS